MEPPDKEYIQPGVEQRGDDHGIERGFGVPQCTKHRGKQIVRHNDDNTGKGDAQIQQRTIDDVIRRVEEQQQRVRNQMRKRCDENRQRKAESKRMTDAFAHAVIISRAKILRNQDAEPLRKARDNAQHHPVRPICRADRRQRLYAHKLPDHRGIHHGIELLKHIAQHQRERKSKDEPRRLAARHILDFLCHERSKSFLLKRAVYFFSRQTVISILSDRFIPRNAPIKN